MAQQSLVQQFTEENEAMMAKMHAELKQQIVKLEKIQSDKEMEMKTMLAVEYVSNEVISFVNIGSNQ